MFHITSLENAKQIMKNNFDIKKCKTHAFGIGVNLSDNMEHLKKYYDK